MQLSFGPDFEIGNYGNFWRVSEGVQRSHEISCIARFELIQIHNF